MDLSNLSHEELKKLLVEVQTAIKTREQGEIQKARDEILGIAQRLGLSLESLLAGQGKTKKQTTKVSAKYRNPEDPSMEWTGRGRQPTWIKDFVEQGGSLEQLLIAQS